MATDHHFRRRTRAAAAWHPWWRHADSATATGRGSPAWPRAIGNNGMGRCLTVPGGDRIIEPTMKARRSGGLRAVTIAALLGLGVLGSGGVTAGCAAQQMAPDASDELLVGFVSGTSSVQAEAIYRPLGAAKVEELREIGVHRIRVAPGRLESVERALRTNPAVRYVERNRPVRPN